MRTISFWLSLILIFMIPWENAITIANFGTLTRVIGFLAVAFWAAAVLTTGRLRKLHSFHLAFWFFVLWNVVSFFWTFGIEETTQRIITYFQLFAMTWLLWDLYTTAAALRGGLQAYILGAYISIGSTVFNYLAGNEALAYSEGRYTGASLNAGDLALILTLGLPIAWHLAVSPDSGARSYVLRLVNYAYLPAALFTIVLTASRMALFAIAPAFLFILGTFSELKFFSRVLIFTTLTGALFALQSFVPQSAIDRLATANASIIAGDLGGRTNLWRAAVTMFFEHPLLGVGSGAFRIASNLDTVVHNTFLSILAELGIIGFVLFVVLLAIVVKQAVRQPKNYSRLWLAILMIWTIGVSAQTWEQMKPTWLFLNLVVIGASVLRPHSEPQRRSDLILHSAQSNLLNNGGLYVKDRRYGKFDVIEDASALAGGNDHDCVSNCDSAVN